MHSPSDAYRTADTTFQSALIRLQLLEDIANNHGRAYAALSREGYSGDVIQIARLAMQDSRYAAIEARNEAEQARVTRDDMVRYS